MIPALPPGFDSSADQLRGHLADAASRILACLEGVVDPVRREFFDDLRAILLREPRPRKKAVAQSRRPNAPCRNP